MKIDTNKTAFLGLICIATVIFCGLNLQAKLPPQYVDYIDYNCSVAIDICPEGDHILCEEYHCKGPFWSFACNVTGNKFCQQRDGTMKILKNIYVPQ